MRRTSRGYWAPEMCQMCHWTVKKGKFDVWLHKKCFWNTCDLFRRALERRALGASCAPYRTVMRPPGKFLMQLKHETDSFFPPNDTFLVLSHPAQLRINHPQKGEFSTLSCIRNVSRGRMTVLHGSNDECIVDTFWPVKNAILTGQFYILTGQI